MLWNQERKGGSTAEHAHLWELLSPVIGCWELGFSLETQH